MLYSIFGGWKSKLYYGVATARMHFERIRAWDNVKLKRKFSEPVRSSSNTQCTEQAEVKKYDTGELGERYIRCVIPMCADVKPELETKYLKELKTQVLCSFVFRLTASKNIIEIMVAASLHFEPLFYNWSVVLRFLGFVPRRTTWHKL